MQRVSARTKSGKAVEVLEMLESEILDQTLEGRLYEAARLASKQGCHSWRIVSSSGARVAQGKAGQAMLSTARAAAQSGPREDRGGW